MSRLPLKADTDQPLAERNDVDGSLYKQLDASRVAIFGSSTSMRSYASSEDPEETPPTSPDFPVLTTPIDHTPLDVMVLSPSNEMQKLSEAPININTSDPSSSTLSSDPGESASQQTALQSADFGERLRKRFFADPKVYTATSCRQLEIIIDHMLDELAENDESTSTSSRASAMEAQGHDYEKPDETMNDGSTPEDPGLTIDDHFRELRVHLLDSARSSLDHGGVLPLDPGQKLPPRDIRKGQTSVSELALRFGGKRISINISLEDDLSNLTETDRTQRNDSVSDFLTPVKRKSR